MSNFKLTEIIRSKVGSLLNEGRMEDVKSRYLEQAHPAIEWLSDEDPSDNNKYLEWMSKQVLYTKKLVQRLFNGNRTQMEEYSDNWKVDRSTRAQMIESIKHFHENTQKYVKKDINQYSNINELFGAMEIAKANLSRSEMKSQGGEKVYEDDNFILIHPKTHEASCKYGSSTRWCVTMKDHSGYFERYSINGPLFFLIDKRRMEPVDSPKYMTKAPDYYKVAIHYQPLFSIPHSRYGAKLNNTNDALNYSNQVSKQSFVGSAGVSIAQIDYWNVQDKKVPDTTFKRYLGGPGRGQKERGDSINATLNSVMEKYTKKLLSDFYDSRDTVVDVEARMEEVRDEMERIYIIKDELSDMHSNLEEYKYFMDRVMNSMNSLTTDNIPNHEFFSNRFNEGSMDELVEKISAVSEKMEEVNDIYTTLDTELESLEEKTKKPFAFYNITNTK